MNFREPFRALTPTLDGPVLHTLARTTEPLTRREIAALVGDASEAGVRKVLRRLVDQGIVQELRIGSRYSYAANREHILWPAVDVMMDASANLEARIRQLVEEWHIRAISVELFGSIAIGESTEASDIDLIVYRPHLQRDQRDQWDGQVTELRMAVERWTGNFCEILEIDPPTLVEMAAAEEPVLRSPRVHISGEDLRVAITALVRSQA